jgi:hypothetical protein
MTRFDRLLKFAPVISISALAFGFLRDVPPGLSALDQIAFHGQGVFPASRLPQMCVAIHPSTATGFENLRLLQEVGASCARSDGETWEGIETSKGVYNWTSEDSLWLPICAAHLSAIMVLTYNNTLYAPSVYHPISPGQNALAFANFARATANHYAPRCTKSLAIEVFNEPNLLVWTTSQWTGHQYAPVLAEVASFVKSVQPRVKIYSGGVSPGDGTQPPNTFVAGMIGTASLVDVDDFAIHPYNFTESPTPPTPPPEHILLDLDSFAVSARRDRRQIVNTEYSFPYQAVGNNLDVQGRYVARAMLATIIGGYPFYTHYDLIDDGTDYSVDQNTFGLLWNRSAKSPYALKPAGVAFKSITGAMSGTQSFRITYDHTHHVATITFTKSTGKVFAIETWDDDSSKSYSTSIGSFLSVSCKDVLGKPYACSYFNGTLSMLLTPAAGPVIVTAR